ncbi:MAG: metal ABC transporter ATP-binding protein [Actinomycetota bacterium]|nr:metal ABC transporter ATP-binding protein [Actinomycetota bacterium]
MTEQRTPAAELDCVCVRYGSVEALHDVTLRIPRGVSVAVIGPNGSGKSTLLGVLSGLVPISSGSAQVLGAPVPPRHGRVAHVLQETPVRPEVAMTVAETIRLGTYAELGLLRRQSAATKERMRAAVERLDIADLLQRQLLELSGGQRQRVLIAQGLIQDAELLLLDEPVAGLDVTSQRIILDVIEAERDRGRTVITTTHDIGSASRADLVVLVATDVIASGPPEDVLTPEHLARAFGGHLHVLPDGTLVLDDPAHHGTPTAPHVTTLDHRHAHDE